MENITSTDLKNICQIEIFNNQEKKSINQHLDLGWVLLNVNSTSQFEIDFETGNDIRVSVTIFSLGWPSDLGTIRVPEINADTHNMHNLNGKIPF